MVDPACHPQMHFLGLNHKSDAVRLVSLHTKEKKARLSCRWLTGMGMRENTGALSAGFLTLRS